MVGALTSRWFRSQRRRRCSRHSGGVSGAREFACKPRTVILCCVGLLVAPISQSKIAPVLVDELLRSSDQIVIATVTQVVDAKVDSSVELAYLERRITELGGSKP